MREFSAKTFSSLVERIWNDFFFFKSWPYQFHLNCNDEELFETANKILSDLNFFKELLIEIPIRVMLLSTCTKLYIYHNIASFHPCLNAVLHSSNLELSKIYIGRNDFLLREKFPHLIIIVGQFRWLNWGQLN